MPPRPSLSGLSRAELEALLVGLFGEIATLKRANSDLRGEIARLKDRKGRPSIKPSGMDKGTEPSKAAGKEKRRGRGKVTPRVTIEERVVDASVPEGSRFKGYEPFPVQDLVISVRAICKVSSPKPRMSCAPDCRPRRSCPLMTPVRVMRGRAAFARRSAMTGSARGSRKAG
ncbi:MAG: hypothetical protein ACREFP_18355 [Acetobacteraceae bacterium]